MGAGRFVCVAVPYGLTFASLICLLIVIFAGITDKSLDLFEIKTQNLSISSFSLENLADLAKRAPFPSDSLSALTVAGLSPNADGSSNITASDLSLADSYRVTLWNYCATTGSNTTCTKPGFSWAEILNASFIEATASSLTGTTVSLPSELKTALETFKVISKFTQMSYVMAVFSCLIEMIIGIFGFCSRFGSCATFMNSFMTVLSLIIASVLATVQACLVTAAVKASVRSYGVSGSLNTAFLATTWLSVAFGIAAGIFWLVTICCCGSNHLGKSKRRGVDDHEKFILTGSYQPVGNNTYYDNGYASQQHNIHNPRQNPQDDVPMQNFKPVTRAGNGAYEPYSQTAI
ncbi:SUR7/PalI family-domain-containing protein [Cadophora sp. MPI-SDFR-AT-0126]|nr:SUR7/PalI family-domain-containing protein [Leotiomycetes sp. MPI-SDFR-AT-0126]